MQAASVQSRLRLRESLDAHPELTIILDATGNPYSRLRARFLAHGEDSIQIQINTALIPNLLISIAGQVETGIGRTPLLGQYRVRSCNSAGIGKYTVDLTPEVVPEDRPKEAAPRKVEKLEPDADHDLDYYEVLQVSRQADSDTIRRVFHSLAQRYHPDNCETGSAQRYREVLAANAVLSDPDRRVAYNVRLVSQDKSRFRIFESAQSAEGIVAEVRKRQGVLRLLYTKRRTDSLDAGMRGRDLVEMLGIPIEHLEFALWQLREQHFINRSDNNRFEITCQGVEAFEAQQANLTKKPVVTLSASA